MIKQTNKQIGAVCDTSIVEPRCEKTGLQAYRPGPTVQPQKIARDLNFGIRRKRDCTIRVA